MGHVTVMCHVQREMYKDEEERTVAELVVELVACSATNKVLGEELTAMRTRCVCACACACACVCVCVCVCVNMCVNLCVNMCVYAYVE